VRAAAPSVPLSSCFGTATSGEPSSWLPLGELEGQERLPAFFFKVFSIFTKIKNLIIFNCFGNVQKNHQILNFFEKFGPNRTLKFQSQFHLSPPFI